MPLMLAQYFQPSGYAELADAFARLLGEVVRHLQVDVERRNERLARPAFLDDLRQLRADVHAPAVGPAILEPAGELGDGVAIEDINVQLALLHEAGQREVAAADIADAGIKRVVAEHKVELGVERVTQIELDDDLSCSQLASKAPQRHLILRCWDADGQLLLQPVGIRSLGSNDKGLINAVVTATDSQGSNQLMFRRGLHADQHTGAGSIATHEGVYQIIHMLPTAQVEVADAEVGPVRHTQGIPERREKRKLNVVIDVRHGGFLCCVWTGRTGRTA